MRTACAILAVVGAVLMLVAACFALLLFLYAEGESSAGELEPRPWTTWYTAIVLAIVVAGIVPFVLTAIVWQRPRLYAQLALWYVALGAVAPIGLFAVMSVVAVASDSNVPTIADGLHVTVRWLPAWLALTLPLSIAGTMAKRIP